MRNICLFLLTSAVALTITSMSPGAYATRADPVSANPARAINGVSPADLEGQAYRVFWEAASGNARAVLQEGQQVALSQVEAHPEFEFFHFYMLDEEGRRISDRRFTLRDLGVFHERFSSVNLKVDETAVRKENDAMMHGSLVPLEKRFDGRYEPVKVFLSEFDEAGRAHARQVSTNFFERADYSEADTRMSFSCAMPGQVEAKVSWYPSWHMPRHENAALYFPHHTRIELDGRFHLVDESHFDAYSFLVTPDIESHLMSAPAGVLKITLHEWRDARYIWSSNGLAEAYSRVKYFCTD